MAATIQNAAPIETEKQHWLHEPATRPAAPASLKKPWQQYIGFFVIALVVATAFSALGVEIRDGWHTHRDWVVPVIVQFTALGGAAFAHLIYRRSWNVFSLGLLFLFMTVLLTGANYVVQEHMPARQDTEDWLSVAAGVALGITMATFIIGSVVHEIRRPTQGIEREAMM